MRRWTYGFATLTMALTALAPGLAAQQPEYYHGPGMMWGGSWFGMVFGFLMMILFVGGIIALVVLAFRWLGTSGHGGGQLPWHGSRAALDILKERLAKGEMDVAEYEERRRALGE